MSQFVAPHEFNLIFPVLSVFHGAGGMEQSGFLRLAFFFYKQILRGTALRSLSKPQPLRREDFFTV